MSGYEILSLMKAIIAIIVKRLLEVIKGNLFHIFHNSSASKNMQKATINFLYHLLPNPIFPSFLLE